MSNNERSQQYFDEARELLDEIERDLLLLEQSDEIDLSLVNEIFRGIHTIKGGADFLGLTQIKELSHAAEDVLDLVRKQQLVLTPEGNSTLLVVTDSLKEMLQNPEQSQTLDISHLLHDIRMMPELVSENAAESIILESAPTENAISESIAPESVVYVDSDEDSVELGTPSSPNLFHLPRKQCSSFSQDGFSLYILELVDSDEPEQAQELDSVLSSLVSIGYIIDSKAIKPDADLEEDSPADGLLYILFRSVLTRTTTIRYLHLDPKNLVELKDVGVEPITEISLTEGDLDASEIGDRRLERRTDRRRKDRRNEERVEDRRGTGVHFEYEEEAEDSEYGIIEDRQKIAGMDDLSAMSELQGAVRGDKKAQGNQSIRVSVEILDELMNLVGELVLTRNQLKQNVESSDQMGTSLTAQRLDIVTSELQESIMSTRMQPLGNILSKFHRIIRDMSNQLGKSVNLALEGEDVELDKSIIENISDPLTHLVRNAIDHGIETPDLRHGSNKPVNATLAITARQEAGHVVIEISDDGRGIDAEKIKEQALEQGIIDSAKAEEITEKEILKLIFTPGFSTAKVVSDISGRGVGLDVVFTNIAKLGGTIDIDTSVGVGTTFRVSLPLTLAIVPSLLISSGGGTFAIPQINLVELVRIAPDQKDKRIDRLGDSTVVRLRDRLLPVIWLDEVLQLDTLHENNDESTNIAVVSSGDFYYGIVVDHFTDSEEIVVKPLGSHLRDCHAYASATILGDGRAALILDINGIAEMVNITNQHALAAEKQMEREQKEKLEKAQENIGKERSLLIVENGDDECFAIELAYVNRIERIRENAVEQMANKHVIKYRGGVLRIFKLDEAIESRAQSRINDHAYLIVFYMMGTEVAIMVSDIVDIVDTHADVDSTTFHGAGIVGSTIIMDRIALLVDLFELVKVIDPTMNISKVDDSRDTSSANIIENGSEHTVLVVEDSLFFQDKLKLLLEEMKVNVLIAGDGQIGWDMLNEHASQIDLVLMDVEMPNMTGLELSRLIRSDDCYTDLPIIMLTSLAKDSDIEEGKKAGASEYMVKMDREMVRQTVKRYLDKSDAMKSAQLNTDNRGEADHHV